MLHFIFAASLLFVKSVLAVDTTAHTATFVLHHGRANGKSVWYIQTDASDAGVAKARGLDFAPDIANLDSTAIAAAKLSGSEVAFAGAPDFSPERTYVASDSGFPPKSATPGGIADAAYSPFVHIEGVAGVINAPIVATGDEPFDVEHHTNTQDRVIAIDTAKHTVTLVLARGFIDAKPVYYLSTEASDPVASAVERATYEPRLAKASPAAEIPIGVVVNGPVAAADAQGLAFLSLHTPLADDATPANVATIGSPFNVLSLVPDTKNPYADNGYSPLWNVMAAGAPQTKRITSYAGIASISKPAGFAVNCPAIAFGDPAAY